MMKEQGQLRNHFIMMSVVASLVLIIFIFAIINLCQRARGDSGQIVGYIMRLMIAPVSESFYRIFQFEFSGITDEGV